MNELNNGIKLGYALPLLEENTATIYNVQITPHGLLTQKTINELGEIIPKDRITYLLCFPEKTFSKQIKSRIDKLSLIPYMFRRRFNRCIN